MASLRVRRGACALRSNTPNVKLTPLQIDARTLEYVSIELITVVIASTSAAVARQEERRRRFELDNAASGSSAAPVASTSKPAPVDGADATDPPENELRQRLDQIGFRIGWGLAERCVRTWIRLTLLHA